jgi:hypothetical protein
MYRSNHRVTAMQLIYNSPQYCVLEFSGFEAPQADRPAVGGFEIMDKTFKREIFLAGADAVHFRTSVQALVAREPSPEEIDDFLGGYTGLMTTPVALH